ncbi:MAG TPA: hypothetical protein DEB39_17000 [Planctomycetaceae bacterium]|nr:hypothetical protein [Planctomycetaceae bacterium]
MRTPSKNVGKTQGSPVRLSGDTGNHCNTATFPEAGYKANCRVRGELPGPRRTAKRLPMFCSIAKVRDRPEGHVVFRRGGSGIKGRVFSVFSRTKSMLRFSAWRPIMSSYRSRLSRW